MKAPIPAACILALTCLTANAQIVVTSESFKARTGIEMKAVDQTIVDANINDRLLEITAQSGTEQTWDLSTFNYVSGDTSISVLMEGLSEAPANSDPRLLKANYLWKYSFLSEPKEETWIFLSIDDTTLTEYGIIAGTAGEQQTLVFDRPVKVIEFPFSYGSYWQDTMTIVFDDSLFPMTFHQTITSTIDGEGTLKMPGGISLPCLRVKQVQTAAGYLGYFNDTVTSYSFIDANGMSLASLSLNHAGIVASYQSTAKVAVQQPIVFSGVDREVPANEIALSASPNPAATTVAISYTPFAAGPIQLTMTNESGVIVHRIAKYVMATEQHERIDITDLSAGLYLVHLHYNGGSAYTKIVVAP